jgi:hypothetical protein
LLYNFISSEQSEARDSTMLNLICCGLLFAAKGASQKLLNLCGLSSKKKDKQYQHDELQPRPAQQQQQQQQQL